MSFGTFTGTCNTCRLPACTCTCQLHVQVHETCTNVMTFETVTTGFTFMHMFGAGSTSLPSNITIKLMRLFCLGCGCRSLRLHKRQRPIQTTGKSSAVMESIQADCVLRQLSGGGGGGGGDKAEAELLRQQQAQAPPRPFPDCDHDSC